MKVELTNNLCIVTREDGDKRPKNESHLLHMVKTELNKQGHDLIKKLMWKDGHMVADTQHYLRSRNRQGHNIAIYDGNYQIFDSCKMYNEDGIFKFNLVHNIWKDQP